MTDIVDEEVEVVIQEDQVLPKLTVRQFIEDLSKFPQDSEIVGSLFGIGLTIPIFQAIQVTIDGKEITVLQMSKQGAIAALDHDMRMSPQTPETTN